MMKGGKIKQAGVTLVELMVGLVIGLLAALVVMQVFSVFEGQKRSTSGTADAQTNGTIALMYLQRSLQTAGYGIPMPNADKDLNILNCTSVAGTGVFPVEITNGNNNGSDTITSRYSLSAAGMVPIGIINEVNVSPGMVVENNMGCASDREMTNTTYTDKYKDVSDPDNNAKASNMVMLMSGTQCTLAEIAEQPTNNNVGGGVGTSYIRLKEVPAGTPVTIGGVAVSKTDKLSCIGSYGDNTFDVANNTLRSNAEPVISEVVDLQAQYGISDVPGNNQVTTWVDATGDWATPMAIADRNKIKAVRVVIVLRNGLREKTKVTTDASLASSSPAIPVSVVNLPNWENYRYRVFSTTVPIRNMLWSKGVL